MTQPLTRQVAPGKQAVRVPINYNRAKALAYARKYWARICSDGFIAQNPWPTGGYKKLSLATKFVHDAVPDADGAVLHSEHAALPDGTTIPFKLLDDCAHFVSCCIGNEPNEAGGGVDVPPREKLGVPGKVPYGIVGAPAFAEWLSSVADVTSFEIPLDKKGMINFAKPGDVIGCRGGPGVKNYKHFMLYMGNKKIACHTYSRCDDQGVGWTGKWSNAWNVGESAGWCKGWTVFRFP